MFAGEKEVNNETTQLISFRNDGAKHVQDLKAVIACEQGMTTMSDKLKWLFLKIKGVISDVEDRVREGTKIGRSDR